jgi:hypothetical protein
VQTPLNYGLVGKGAIIGWSASLQELFVFRQSFMQHGNANALATVIWRLEILQSSYSTGDVNMTLRLQVCNHKGWNKGNTRPTMKATRELI